jgi:hypothetical protein
MAEMVSRDLRAKPVPREILASAVSAASQVSLEPRVKRAIKVNQALPASWARADLKAKSDLGARPGHRENVGKPAKRAIEATLERAGQLANKAIVVRMGPRDSGVRRVTLVPTVHLANPARRETEAMTAKKVRKAIKARKVKPANKVFEELRASEVRRANLVRTARMATKARMGNRGS